MKRLHPTKRRGEGHPKAQATNAQIARAKRLLLEAERVTFLAPGELDRIAAATGLSARTVKALKEGTRWVHIDPAPATAEAATA